MRRIEDLSHDEKIALDTDAIEKFVKIEVAEAGIKPVLPPDEPTYQKVALVPDNRLFKVHGLLVKSKEEAVTIASMDIYRSDYDFKLGYDYHYAEKETNANIEETFLHTKKAVIDLAPILQSNKTNKEQYDGQKSVYDEYLNKTHKVREAVMVEIHEATDREREIVNAVKSFEEYKDIADNDEAVAVKFFNKAFDKISNEIKEIALGRCGVKWQEESTDNQS